MADYFTSITSLESDTATKVVDGTDQPDRFVYAAANSGVLMGFTEATVYSFPVNASGDVVSFVLPAGTDLWAAAGAAALSLIVTKAPGGVTITVSS